MWRRCKNCWLWMPAVAALQAVAGLPAVGRPWGDRPDEDRMPAGMTLLFAPICRSRRGIGAANSSPVEVTERTLARIDALKPDAQRIHHRHWRTAPAPPRTRPRPNWPRARTGGCCTASPSRSRTWWTPRASARPAGRASWRSMCRRRMRGSSRHLRASGAVLVGKTNCSNSPMASSTPTSGPPGTLGPDAHRGRLQRRLRGRGSGGPVLCRGRARTRAARSASPAAYCGVAGLKPTYDAGQPRRACSRSPGRWTTPGPSRGRRRRRVAARRACAGTRPTPVQPAALDGLRLGVLAAHSRRPGDGSRGRGGLRAACDALPTPGPSWST